MARLLEAHIVAHTFRAKHDGLKAHKRRLRLRRVRRVAPNLLSDCRIHLISRKDTQGREIQLMSGKRRRRRTCISPYPESAASDLEGSCPRLHCCQRQLDRVTGGAGKRSALETVRTAADPRDLCGACNLFAKSPFLGFNRGCRRGRGDSFRKGGTRELLAP